MPFRCLLKQSDIFVGSRDNRIIFVTSGYDCCICKSRPLLLDCVRAIPSRDVANGTTSISVDLLLLDCVRASPSREVNATPAYIFEGMLWTCRNLGDMDGIL